MTNSNYSPSKNFFDKQYEQRAFWIKYIKDLDIFFRKDIYNKFLANLEPNSSEKILDLGVTDLEINYFHSLYPYKNKITAAGLAKNNKIIEKNFPQIKYIQVSETFPYKFKNNEFDIVHASAVIEHVGDRERQKIFLAESYRIGKRGMISTPNRWFPIELHTYIPLLHYLPTKSYRRIYELLGMEFYSKEKNLNLLTKEELIKLAKELKLKKYWLVAKYTFGFVSNYLLFWDKSR